MSGKMLVGSVRRKSLLYIAEHAWDNQFCGVKSSQKIKRAASEGGDAESECFNRDCGKELLAVTLKSTNIAMFPGHMPSLCQRFLFTSCHMH